jgi:TetR/AcrR family transcriptional regulator, mexJK operon transcriptional repressor
LLLSRKTVRYSSVQKEPQGENRPDPKEEKILAAAVETFLELGYSGASMDIVAQRAHASKTTVYTRFPSKEALFSAMISAHCVQRGMGFDIEELVQLPPDAALQRIGRNFLDLILSPEAVRMEQIVTGEAPRFPEVARIFYEAGPQRVRALVARYLDEARARGLLAVEDPEFAARHFLMALKAPNCEEMLGLDALPPEDRDDFVARAVRLFLNGAAPR